MKTGPLGKALIKSYEKLVLHAYMPTPNDRPTIGWGSTVVDGKPVKMGDLITQEKADLVLDDHLSFIEGYVSKLLEVPLTQNQFDAIISFVYNVGTSAFASSTLLKLMNEEKFVEASEQFGRWVKQKGITLPGLVKRRKAERDLFMKPGEDDESRS